MAGKTKRLVLGVLAALLCTANFMSTAYASDLDDLKIDIQSKRYIDVVLTVGDTQMNVSNFASDLINELGKRGVDTSKVNVQALETKSVSTNDANAQVIFEEWENYPNDEGKWELTEYQGKNVIRSTKNVMWTGFWNEDDANEVVIETKVGVTNAEGDDDQIGISFMMNRYKTGDPNNPYQGNIDAYDMYYLMLDGGGLGDSGLFKAKSAPYPVATSDGNINSMWKVRENFKKDWSQFPKTYFLQNGSEVPYQTWGDTVPPDAKGYIIPLQRTNTAKWKWQQGVFYNVKIKVSGNRIEVWIDGKKEIDYVDNDDPISSGGYGPFASSQAYGTFQDFSVTATKKKKFTEVIRQPEWREYADRYLVNVEDKVLQELNNPQEKSEILTRLINEGISYIALGTSANQNQALSLIQANNGNGTFINNSNYSQAMSQLADYIAGDQQVETPVHDEEAYLLLGEQLDINVIPSHLKTNTATKEYPNGRWKLVHDPLHFENSLGQYAKSGMYQPDLILEFDKTGKYELWFADKRPTPHTIYVHRKPIADFSVHLEDRSDHYRVQVQDMSYDLDAMSKTNRGIVEHQWKWKEAEDATWNEGVLPSTLPKGKNYIVQLRVKDEQGTWSDPVSKYVTTSNVAVKPVAYFDVSQSVAKYKSVDIHDASYDPSGKSLTEALWIVQKDKAVVYSGANPLTDFSQLGEGTYKITLKVKNQDGLWSEEFSRYVVITSDKQEPEIFVTPARSDDTNQDIHVLMVFVDEGGSGFDAHRYVVTNSASFPTDGWSSWDTSTERQIMLTEEGTWYIHVEAKDKEGNMTRRTIGEYRIDKTPPAKPTIIASETKPTNQNVVVEIQFADDAAKRMVKVGNEGDWVEYAGPIVLEHNGVIYAKAQDLAGNWSEEAVFVVNNIDKTAPDAPWFEVSTTKPTNQDVTVVVHYPQDAFIKQIRIGEGEWVEYVSPITLSENNTVFARALDEAGNVSEEAYIVVSNIDKVPPALPSVRQNGNEIAVLYDEEDDVIAVQISINGQPWMPYRSPLKLNDGEYTVEVKVVDEAGNESYATVHIVAYANTLNKAYQLVEAAENYPTEYAINRAKETVFQLPDVALEKQDLLDRLFALEYQLLLKDAERKVRQAEQYLREPYVSNALDAVNKLPDGSDKDRLFLRMDDVLKAVEEKNRQKEQPEQSDLERKLKEATQKVEQAERYKREPYLSNAQEAIDGLPDGEEKQALQHRLDVVFQSIEQEELNKIYQEAEQKVKLAEQYKREPYLTQADEAVQKLPDGEEKNQLLNRLDAVRRQIEQEALDKLFADAEKKVVQAENYRREPYIGNALEAVLALPEGERKRLLLDRVLALLPNGEESNPKDGQFNPGDNIVDVAHTILNPEARKIYVDWAKAVERAEKYFSRANILYAVNKLETVPYELIAAYQSLYDELWNRTMILKQIYNDMVANQELEKLISKATLSVETYERFGTERYRQQAQEAVDLLPDGDVKEMLQRRIDAVNIARSEND